MEQVVVSGVAYSKGDARITLAGLPDVPGVAARIFTEIAREGIVVDMIIQGSSGETELANLSFTVPRADRQAADDREDRQQRPALGLTDGGIDQIVGAEVLYQMAGQQRAHDLALDTDAAAVDPTRIAIAPPSKVSLEKALKKIKTGGPLNPGNHLDLHRRIER